MRAAGLAAPPAGRRAHTTQADDHTPSVTNLWPRDLTADAPNRKGGVDITGIWTDEGRLYLAGVLDWFSRRRVGWAMADPMPDALTQAALKMATLARCPPDELLHPADPASQYTRDESQALLEAQPRLASFCDAGGCYDNAPMKRFLRNLGDV